ncbi:MAG: acetyltransferase, partial [Pseudomonadota bacterium]
HCNIYSYVAHDSIVGDYVTLGPRVSVNGRVSIEDGAYIGSGATILPGNPDKFLVIGAGATVGAGAIVTKSVKPGEVVVGNPARPIARCA